jgi:hypothetical protein
MRILVLAGDSPNLVTIENALCLGQIDFLTPEVALPGARRAPLALRGIGP